VTRKDRGRTQKPVARACQSVLSAIRSFNVENLEGRTLLSTGTGTGLLGFYFNEQNIVNRAPVFTTQPIATRLDAVIDFNGATDFDTGSGRPAGFNHDNEQILWKGQIQAESSENYTLCTASDDGTAIYLDNKLVTDNNYYQGRTTRCSQPIALTDGSL